MAMRATLRSTSPMVSARCVTRAVALGFAPAAVSTPCTNRLMARVVSRVATMAKSGRAFHLLESLGTHPAITYLKRLDE